MTGKRWWLWMALVAVWLTALAPTVSRTVAFALPDLGAWCEPVGHHHDGAPASHDDGDAACGYCTLFASTPTLGSGVLAASVTFVTGSTEYILTPVPGIAARALFPIHPRGPPAVVTA